MFNLAALKAVAAVDEPTTVELSALSVHLILAALGYAEDYGNWAGDFYDLTDLEKDEIDAVTARAVDEILGGG